MLFLFAFGVASQRTDEAAAILHGREIFFGRPALDWPGSRQLNERRETNLRRRPPIRAQFSLLAG
ncbi:hypothetical protein X734_07105 [Mesorhizobium sp. L2C084A000]|nr:hypothetical protein X734_07105 [Mesorhizobium sp. L2C084A000]